MWRSASGSKERRDGSEGSSGGDNTESDDDSVAGAGEIAQRQNDGSSAQQTDTNMERSDEIRMTAERERPSKRRSRSFSQGHLRVDSVIPGLRGTRRQDLQTRRITVH